MLGGGVRKTVEKKKDHVEMKRLVLKNKVMETKKFEPSKADELKGIMHNIEVAGSYIMQNPAKAVFAEVLQGCSISDIDDALKDYWKSNDETVRTVSKNVFFHNGFSNTKQCLRCFQPATGLAD